ncbi:S1/P1 nuclease [Candidatus Phyllobacterium onerii]|uniref:S1/P1 nuclease n=1 Tax=Candidatus Phyllobacterium onerii TaxID=3020828 RepID=UPI00232B224A|nr:S1/P1 nuclease [Phyllobacterium sp. IY22]
MRRIALTVALLFAATNVAFAWGHSIIAEIAQSRLTPLTLQRVADLPGSGSSLAPIASWADDERARDKTTTRWHLVDIPRIAPGYDPARDCVLDASDSDCIIAAINRQLSIVACPSLPLEPRQRALEFLVHFVGDLHQPLHAIGEEGRLVPANGLLDDDYRRENLPVLDTLLSRAGLRLAKTLNDAFAKGDCSAEQA